jgi:uncharacterized protein YbgA (DUF1722 family)/uncharacterized protein YbbK (DUF523 family)
MINDHTVGLLAGLCDVVTACPEADTGLGVPRDPVRLVMVEGQVRMVQPATALDHSDAMRAYCAAKAAELKGYGGAAAIAPTAGANPAGLSVVDGALLKSRSPSCGIKDVKIYRKAEPGAMFDTGAGLFGQAVMEALNGAPVEDEGRLKNYAIREHFFSCLYALARFRHVALAGKPGGLVEYHARHKLMFLAMNQASMRRLGRIVANPDKRPLGELLAAYRAELGTMFSTQAKPGGFINTALHAFGGFSDKLSVRERTLFINSIEEYRDERIPASALLALLKSWALRFEVDYLLDQTFLDPYPKELVEITDSGKGRDR